MKRLFVAIQALFVFPFLAFSAFAQTNPVKVNPCADLTNPFAKTICSLGGDNTGRTLGNIVIAIVVLAVIIALLYLLYGGLKWVTSRGEKDQVEAARNHIIAAIVGLVVVFLAIFIVSLVLGLFGINLGQLEIPKIVP